MLDALAGALDERVPGLELGGDVGAELGGDPKEVLRREGISGELVRDAESGGGVGAPAAETRGHRDALLDRDRERRQLPAGTRAELGQRAGGEVVARHAAALDGVATRLLRLGRDLVREIDRGHQ